MAEEQDDISTIAPQKLIGSFSKNRVLLCIFVAVVAHIFVIGGTSTDFIYYNWINPEAGLAREERLRAEREAEEERAREDEEAKRIEFDKAVRMAVSNEMAAAAAEKAAAEGATNAPAASTNAVSAEMRAIPAKYRDSKIVKETLQVAPKKEIPKDPDDLGISIQETNPM